MHDNLLAKRGYRNRATCYRQRLRVAGRTPHHSIRGIESRIGASVGVTRAPLDKLYDDTDGATTQLGIFALATNDATNNTVITDANRTAAWGDTDNYGILLNNVQAAVTAWPQQGGTDEKPDGLKTTRRRRLHYIKIMPQTVSTTIRCRRNTTILSTVTPLSSRPNHQRRKTGNKFYRIRRLARHHLEKRRCRPDSSRLHLSERRRNKRYRADRL